MLFFSVQGGIGKWRDCSALKLGGVARMSVTESQKVQEVMPVKERHEMIDILDLKGIFEAQHYKWLPFVTGKQE